MVGPDDPSRVRPESLVLLLVTGVPVAGEPDPGVGPVLPPAEENVVLAGIHHGGKGVSGKAVLDQS